MAGGTQRQRAANGGESPFWEDPDGLDLVSASLQPGGRTLRFRLRFGQAYEIELGALGFSGPGMLAGLDPGGHCVVLFLGPGQHVDLSVKRLLAVADPAFREAMERAAAAPTPVGALIRARRLSLGRTARLVAREAGLTPGAWSRLEASRHSPRLATLERVAKVLGTDVAGLLTGPA